MARQKMERQFQPGPQPIAATARLRLSVRVTPRSAQQQLVRDGDKLKVRLTAAPVEGAANQALITFLAASLSLPKRALRIISGASGRDKIVEIEGLATLTELWERLKL